MRKVERRECVNKWAWASYKGGGRGKRTGVKIEGSSEGNGTLTSITSPERGISKKKRRNMYWRRGGKGFP